MIAHGVEAGRRDLGLEGLEAVLRAKETVDQDHQFGVLRAQLASDPLSFEGDAAGLVAPPGPADVERVEEPAVTRVDVLLNSPASKHEAIGPELLAAEGADRDVPATGAVPLPQALEIGLLAEFE